MMSNKILSRQQYRDKQEFWQNIENKAGVVMGISFVGAIATGAMDIPLATQFFIASTLSGSMTALTASVLEDRAGENALHSYPKILSI